VGYGNGDYALALALAFEVVGVCCLGGGDLLSDVVRGNFGERG